MTSSEWDRSRRRAQAIGTLAVLAVLAAVVAVVATVVPDAWWPRIGSAFTASPQPTTTTPSAGSAEPCARITGPVKDTCTRTPVSSVTQHGGVSAVDAWRLAVPAGGLILVYAVRSSGRRRR